MLKIISLYEPYSNFQKYFENEPKNISTCFINNFNNQLEEEYCPEIFRGFRGFNEYKINNYSKKDLNNESYIFNNILSEETNDETEKIRLNIENNNENIRCQLMNPFNVFDNSNKEFSFSGDYYNSENSNNNTNNNINNFINNNFLFVNDNTEKKKEGILIGKKRRLFNISYPKSFNIFNKGNDNYIKQLIKESLQNHKKYFFSKNSEEIIGGKDRDDNMRKKIKTKFHKALKNKVNQLLSLVGSKKKFNNLPQEFIININKRLNRGVLDLTFKELYSQNFCKNKINNNSSLQKYKDNQSVLKYLEKEKEISKKSKYDIFKDMKYYQIFDEYLRSEEFEKDIYELKEKYNNKYIKNYIKIAFELNDFFNY